jgi:hypothetical protein
VSLVARVCCALVLCAACGAAHAQDFAGAAHAAATDDAFALLEHALPSATAGLAAAVAQTRWWESSDLETRAAALCGSWRTLRASAGLSQTGVPELGWTALALAAGSAGAEAGAGLRACARVDRDAPWSAARVAAPGAGYELGAGAWLVPAAGVRVWASAPQMLTRGAAPPLARSLEVGVRAGDDTGVWLLLRAPRAGDDGERALGLAIALVPVTAWAEVRDAPLRGAAGVQVTAGAVSVEARVDVHPVLGETVRVALSWSHAPSPAP